MNEYDASEKSPCRSLCVGQSEQSHANLAKQVLAGELPMFLPIITDVARNDH